MKIRDITWGLIIIFALGIVIGLLGSIFILGLNLLNPDPFTSIPYGKPLLGIAMISFAGLVITAIIDGTIEKLTE